jgi:hypothetical protein
MQFRPVRVERPDEEQAPEGPDFGDQAGFTIPMVCYPGRRCESRHDEPAFFVRRLLSRGALFWALAGSFRLESLKEGFNCCYR